MSFIADAGGWITSTNRSAEAVRWTSNGWEPDALTAHVRIYERATSIVHGHNIVHEHDIVDTTTGNQVANRENKPYPKHKRIALLTRNGGPSIS